MPDKENINRGILFAAVLLLLCGGGVLAATAYLNSSQTQSNKDWENMSVQEQESFVRNVSFANAILDKRAVASAFVESENSYKSLAMGSEDELIYGKREARYIVTEYSDIECPACRFYYPFTKQLVDKYHDEVALSFKYYPLSFHDPIATNETAAAICVGKFKGKAAEFAVVDRLFADTRSNGEGSELLSKIPEAFGIDKSKFQKCIEDPNTHEIIAQYKADGDQAEISGTPTLVFIDTVTGNKLTAGGGNLEQLEQHLNKLKEVEDAR